jgi:hypothetical protein
MLLQHSRRLIAAFLLAPLVPASALTLISLVGNPLEGVWTFFLLAPISYAVAALPGLPLFVLFRRLAWISSLGCVTIGLICGLTAAVFIMHSSLKQALSSSSDANWAPFISVSLIGAFFGCISGYIFFKIMMVGRVMPPPAA